MSKCNFYLYYYYIIHSRLFVKQLRLAQKTAFQKKKRVEVLWRDYRTYVEPTGNEFDHNDVREKLLNALREILKLHNLSKFSPSEEKVNNVFFFCFLKNNNNLFL